LLIDMKRRSKIIIVIILLSLSTAVAWFASDYIHGKLLIGTARVLKNKVPIILTVDGNLINGVLCFREPCLYNGGASKRLVLWLENPQAVTGRKILIVDPEKEKVFIPNSSTRDYKLLLNRWLLQSESGSVGVAFGYSKLDKRDPDFQMVGNLISFTIPSVLNLPPGRWNIQIKEKSS